jgi:hypothetical protein
MDAPVWPTAPGFACPAFDGLDPADRTFYLQVATEWLWLWTGRTFGIVPASVRPAWHPATGTWQGPVPAGLAPPLVACPAGRPREVNLPGRVYDIVSVTIDGADFDDWWWRRPRTLIRTDGVPWPRQDLTVPDGEPGSWQINYQVGVDVPAGGRFALSVLACEIARAKAGDNRCRLPQRVQTVVREGVTVGFMDDFAGLEAGKVGLVEVDSWVSSVMRPPRRAKIAIPGRVR